MNFDAPASKNPIDQLKVVGQPVDRIDGPLKTTGQAKYAYEQQDVVANQAYGVIVGSSIAKGRVLAINTEQARQVPGVLTIVTFQTVPSLQPGDFYSAKALAGPEIEHYHQAVAVAVADSLEQAQAAAELIQVTYQRAPGQYELSKILDTADVAPGSPDTDIGRFQETFRTSAFQVDQRYRTPDQSHAMMEPFASMAMWKGDQLTLWTSNQMIEWSVQDMAKTLQIPAENIRVISPYIGGGFGGKLFIRADALLAVLGARATGRPVKVALSRPLIANNTTHRAATIQRIRIGATKDGHITAIGHENWSGDLNSDKAESGVRYSRPMYAGAHRMSQSRVASLDLAEANAMRAPSDAPGSMAVEIAMDEMAEKVGLDPVQFRILNDTQVDPEHPERRYSQRKLIECLTEGARRFGWSERAAQPATKREGAWLIGLGMAGAFRDSPVTKSAARVRLDGNGMVTVETDMTDIGTGSYVIIGQTAAEMMGVPLDRVVVKLGDSSFPVSAGSGGQWGGNSSTSGVYAACVKLRTAVAQKLDFDADQAVFENGEVRQGERRVSLTEAATDSNLVGEDAIEFGELDNQYRLTSFGSHFVEVAVHAHTGEVRVRRMLAVCAAGRILNPKTARSQIIGAMTMGVGAALMEELAVDTRYGFFVNHDLASYEVPVHADIPHQEVVFLDEVDPLSSPMKARGVGELGICGVAAAVANAIYNATGVRVRNYPVTLDKLLGGMPQAI